MNKIAEFFKFEERETGFRKEIIGGLVTFLSMCYILAVNPNMVSQAGVPLGGAFIATAVGAMIGTLIMAFVANFPVALAPGMGVNAFFTYTICMTLGFTWQEALAASLISGLIFVAISFTPLRKKLIEAIPSSLRAAIGVGIGFFICYVGLMNAGIVTVGGAGLPSIGDFSEPTVLVALVGIALIFIIANLRGKVRQFSFIIAIIGTGIIYAILAACKVPGIPSITLHQYSELGTFGETFGACFDGFGTLFKDGSKLVILPVVVFALLFVDIFDTAGTLVAVSKVAKLEDENGDIPKLDRALFADAIGTLVSATMGTPEITSYVESASGVEAGARTGFSGIVVAALFGLSILLFPVMAIFSTPAVTSMALIFVGVLMAGQITEIDWKDRPIAIASVLTIIGMVVTYSIADGIAFGFISYTIAMLASKRGKEVNVLIYVFSALFIVYFALGAHGYRVDVPWV